jgi:hypothetical protein
MFPGIVVCGPPDFTEELFLDTVDRGLNADCDIILLYCYCYYWYLVDIYWPIDSLAEGSWKLYYLENVY